MYINYPNNYDYTRSVEIKHVTKQKISSSSISYEYPKDSGDPYYPVPRPSSKKLYLEYQKLSKEAYKKEKVIFVGRLAEYTYINTDEAVRKGLNAFESILERNETN